MIDTDSVICWENNLYKIIDSLCSKTFSFTSISRSSRIIFSKYDFDMDMRKGRAVVDAKSLLGIMHLGLNNVIELQMYSDHCEELQKELEKYAA